MFKYLVLMLLVVGVMASMCGGPPTTTAPRDTNASVSATRSHIQELEAARLKEVAAKDLWVAKGAIGAELHGDLDKILDAYGEGEDVKAIKLLNGLTRRGVGVIFGKDTPVTYLDEYTGPLSGRTYIKVKPKGPGKSVWVLGKQMWEKTNERKSKKRG